MSRNSILFTFFGVIVLAMMGLAVAYVFPWKNIEWGSVKWTAERTITVTGEASKQEQNQIARFSAGVSAVGDDKDKVVTEVNDKVNEVIAAVKAFGIDSKDIKTQNMSIYQQEETYWDGGVQKQRQGQWRANNTVEVVLRQVDRANELADLLSKSGANNVYGPSFSLDDTKTTDNDLLKLAIDNAREKAEAMAENSGVRLGKVVSVNEGYGSSPVYPIAARAMDGVGGGAAVEPGSSQISKTVTVVFAIE